MKIPGFSAEASLYGMNEHYKQCANIDPLRNGSSTVYPQGCSWWKWIPCTAPIVTCTMDCNVFAWDHDLFVGCMNWCLKAHLAGGCFECVE